MDIALDNDNELNITVEDHSGLAETFLNVEQVKHLHQVLTTILEALPTVPDDVSYEIKE